MPASIKISYPPFPPLFLLQFVSARQAAICRMIIRRKLVADNLLCHVEGHNSNLRASALAAAAALPAFGPAAAHSGGDTVPRCRQERWRGNSAATSRRTPPAAQGRRGAGPTRRRRRHAAIHGLSRREVFLRVTDGTRRVSGPTARGFAPILRPARSSPSLRARSCLGGSGRSLWNRTQTCARCRSPRTLHVPAFSRAVPAALWPPPPPPPRPRAGPSLRLCFAVTVTTRRAGSKPPQSGQALLSITEPDSRRRAVTGICWPVEVLIGGDARAGHVHSGGSCS